MCNVTGDSSNDGVQLNMSRVDGLTVKSTCTVHCTSTNVIEIQEASALTCSYNDTPARQREGEKT